MLINFDVLEKAEKSNVSYDEGIYQVKIINVEEKKSKNTGNEYWRVTFETMRKNVFKVSNNYFFTEKSLSIFLNLMTAIGLYNKENKKDLRFEKEDLLGCTLQLELVYGEENENGKKYLEIKPWTCESIGNKDEEIPF